jgi:hypothetical protein
MGLFIFLLVAGVAMLFSSSATRRMPAATEGLDASAQIQSLFHNVNSLSMGDRMAAWSATLRDNSKVLFTVDGMASMVKNDTVPLVPKTFDCTTFVETVAALARSTSARDIAGEILSIRYKNGEPGFYSRNHFPEVDWIPNNRTAGILRDVTEDVMAKAGEDAETVTKKIEKRKWFEAQTSAHGGRSIASLKGLRRGDIPESTEAKVKYMPVDKIEKAMAHIPNGAIVNIVHAESDQHPVVISHQGIMVKRGKHAYFRHARRGSGVKDSPFLAYMQAQKNAAWPLVGINVNVVQGD